MVQADNILKYRLAELIKFSVKTDENNSDIPKQQFNDHLWSGPVTEDNLSYLKGKIPNLEFILQIIDPSLLSKNKEQEKLDIVVETQEENKKEILESKNNSKTVPQELLALALIFTNMVSIMPEKERALLNAELDEDIELAFAGDKNNIAYIKNLTHDLCNAKSPEDNKKAIEKAKLSEVLTDEEINNIIEGNIIKTQIFNITRLAVNNSDKKNISNNHVKDANSRNNEIKDKVKELKEDLVSKLNQSHKTDIDWTAPNYQTFDKIAYHQSGAEDDFNKLKEIINQHEFDAPNYKPLNTDKYKDKGKCGIAYKQEIDISKYPKNPHPIT